MERILIQQKNYLEQQGTISITKRIEALKKLKQSIKKYENEILKALEMDLGKSEMEGYATEVGFVYHSINYALKHVKKWSKPKRVKNDLAQLPGKSYIYASHYGSVLIIGPYNYPFQLLIEPLIGAIAGGNTVVLKPSEYTTHTEEIIQQLIKETFDESYIAVVTGDYQVNSALLDLPFDYVFFTGSVPVGKIVMEKCSKYLTPHTLELGGKSPVIVDSTADLKLAAQRIAWGKFTNVGQTCVAPDYVLVHESIYNDFVIQMKKVIEDFYGNNASLSPDYGKIVNERHMKRLENIIVKDASKIIYGGTVDHINRYISPTLFTSVTLEDEIMKDEIFGPLLPLLKYKDERDLKQIIHTHNKPLALYVFTSNYSFAERIITTYSFGGGCVNDVVTHVASQHLPFGGVGPSGIGRYHGIHSFNTFTYQKAIVKRSTSNIPLVFPPYKNKVKLIRKIMK